MGIKQAPHVCACPISDAIDLVKDRFLFKSFWGDFAPEGLVGKPPLGILGRDGDRLMIKIKPKDFV